MGLLLLLEASSGAILLYANELARSTHPQLYTVTRSDHPMSQRDALNLVRREHPELRAAGVAEYHGLHLVRGDSASRDTTDAFVDPGTGRINGIAAEQPRFVLLMVNLHDCGLGCRGMPGYLPWLSIPLPSLFGTARITVGGYILAVLGVVMIFLAASGAVAWWPGARALMAGFTVRRGRGSYIRDLDLHRVIGIASVPFLLMWGITGAAFYFDWPAQVYFAALPGHANDVPPKPPIGAGPMLSLEQATVIALAAHPSATVRGFAEIHPETQGGTYGFRLAKGFDPYEQWNFAGNLYIGVDSHGGGVQDYAPDRPGAPLTERLWNQGVYDGLHFGTLVAGWPRLVWLLFGLTPVVLSATGLTIWLTKSRSARNRRRARPAHQLRRARVSAAIRSRARRAG